MLMIVALFKQAVFQPQNISYDATDIENNSIHAMRKLTKMTLLHVQVVQMDKKKWETFL